MVGEIFCQWRSKVGQISVPTRTGWWNIQTKQWPEDFLALFYFSCTSPFQSPHLSAPLHPAPVYPLSRVPGVSETCGNTSQLLQCLLNYGKSLEAMALMKHAAKSHISQHWGETCCCTVNYSAPKYHSNHHATTGGKKPPANAALPPWPCLLLNLSQLHWRWQYGTSNTLLLHS